MTSSGWKFFFFLSPAGVNKTRVRLLVPDVDANTCARNEAAATSEMLKAT